MDNSFGRNKSQAYHFQNIGEDQQGDGDQYRQFDEEGEGKYKEKQMQERHTKQLLATQLIEDADLSQYQSKSVKRAQRAREFEDYKESHGDGALKGVFEVEEKHEKIFRKEGEDCKGSDERKTSGLMHMGVSRDAGDEKGYQMELRLVTNEQPVQVALLWIDLDSEIEFKKETIELDAQRPAYTTQVTFKELMTHPSVRFELRLNGDEYKGKPV